MKKEAKNKFIPLIEFCKNCANFNFVSKKCAHPYSKQITKVFDGVTMFEDCDKYIPLKNNART